MSKLWQLLKENGVDLCWRSTDGWVPSHSKEFIRLMKDQNPYFHFFVCFVSYCNVS